MDIIGKWKFKSIEVPDFENFENGVTKTYTAEQLANSEEDSQWADYANTILEFLPNGATAMWMKIPEGLNIDDLSEEDKKIIASAVDGYIQPDESKATWEESNGQFFMVGEYEDNGKPSRNEIIVNPDGTITNKNFISNITYERK